MYENIKALNNQKTEELLLTAVNAMRADPAKYREIQRSLSEAGSDRDKVKQLLQFATSEKELAALLPPGSANEQEAMGTTTVTVTTVLI